ncbi:glycosyltransferase family 9 protein [Ktedonosporobacter rubrisoli]|uniref:glycosyltransferase family 9 protein n=1 Tax=Ktedonosporobacter rubrisoli TaxID=2509675 RepID=UPI0013EE7F7C|nr:glycosyltransferase family 9 protein [Ktedonosporobacter rubrisoli]
MTLDVGIGDAIVVGLSAIDQIVANDPLASGTIDILCNALQAQIFACDPRINRIIETNKVFFPGANITQWLRGIALDPAAARIIDFLKQRSYEAVLPSIVAPGLYSRLHSHIMYPSIINIAEDFLAFCRQQDFHLSTIARDMVDHYFGKAMAPLNQVKDIPLYISSQHVKLAISTLEALKAEAKVTQQNTKLLIVAPDTASTVTRPPTDLLIAGIYRILAVHPHLMVYILPSYTATGCSLQLLKALSKDYPQRIFLMPAEPKAHLLEMAALIDQSDVFLSGDTGVMHLAAAYKKLNEGDDISFAPRNSAKIVALFGGTNPGYYGYSRRTTILGRGRREQTALRPGFFKEAYKLKGRNLFDHITSKQILDAVLDQ